MAADDNLYAFDLSGDKNFVLTLVKLLQLNAASNCGSDQCAKASDLASNWAQFDATFDLK